MDEINFALKDAAIAYLIASAPDPRFPCHTSVCGGSLTVSHTAATDVLTAEQDGRAAAVIGYCVDAHGELARGDIPAQLLSQTFPDAMVAFRYFDRFAGAYLVLYQEGDKLFLWGDATCSLPICYSVSGHAFCAAMTDKLAADLLGLAVSAYSLKIRNGSTAYSQPLPNDLTMYDGVKVLLPNHYLDCGSRKAVRVPLGVRETKDPQELAAIVDRTAALARTVTAYYRKDFNIACPMTAGSDSRTILSFLLHAGMQPECYTYQHHFTKDSAEIAIPTQICERYGLAYHVLPDQNAPEACVRSIDEVMGPYYHENDDLGICYTLRAGMGKCAIIEGTIIDEVGKSTQEHAVPVALLNVPFFMCKLHNYEKAAKPELKKYIEEIDAAGERAHLADLFAMEQKLGRRVGPISTQVFLCGTPYLNMFNCRELILQWCRIPRKLRVKKYLPLEFLRQNAPGLLEYPINPEARALHLLKKYWFTFYPATFAKYLLGKRRHSK